MFPLYDNIPIRRTPVLVRSTPIRPLASFMQAWAWDNGSRPAELCDLIDTQA